MNYSFSLEIPEMVKYRLGQYSTLIRQETEMPEAYEWEEPANYDVLMELIGNDNFADLRGHGYNRDQRFRNKERKLIRKATPTIASLTPFTLEFSEIKFRAHLSFVAIANDNSQYQTLLLAIRTLLRDMGMIYILDFENPPAVTLASYKIGRAGTPPDMVALVPKMSVPCEITSITLRRVSNAEESSITGPRWVLLKRWRLG